MVSNDKRYADLPQEVRAFLETLGSQGVVNLANVVRFYEEISAPREGKIAPIDMLRGMHPETLRWLLNARPEDIDNLEASIKLLTSSLTVGKFMKWAIITLIGTFVLMSQFGDALLKIVALVRGASK